MLALLLLSSGDDAGSWTQLLLLLSCRLFSGGIGGCRHHSLQGLGEGSDLVWLVWLRVRVCGTAPTPPSPSPSPATARTSCRVYSWSHHLKR